MLQPAFFRFTEQTDQDIRNNQIQYSGNTEGGKRLIRCRVDIAGDFQQVWYRCGKRQRRGVQH